MDKGANRNALLALEDDALLQRCRQETYRASGPGGQHRNKTDSAVRLSVMDGAVVASCANHRSQHRNRSEALRRLRIVLTIDIRAPLPPEREAEHWNGSWKLGRKDRRYAGFLAHVLDVLAHNEWAVGHAAEGLGVSTGKLVRSLSHDPAAWNTVNQARAKIGLVNLRRP